MADSSDSDSYCSDDSEYNYIPGKPIITRNFTYNEEDETSNIPEDQANNQFIGPYVDEPLADPEWLRE